jgi:hypothetical protein
MRIRRITISAAFAAGLTALPLSTAKAQYHPHQHQQPTAQSTADQLNREELARHQPAGALNTGWSMVCGLSRSRRRE